MFSSSWHKREQNGCFGKKKEIRSTYESLRKSKKHLKHLCTEMEPFPPYPFVVQCVFTERRFCVRLFSTPWTRKRKSSCLLGTYFLMEGGRQENYKQITLYSDKYYEEQKWAGEWGRVLLQVVSGKAFPGWWYLSWQLNDDKEPFGKIEKTEYSVQRE